MEEELELQVQMELITQVVLVVLEYKLKLILLLEVHLDSLVVVEAVEENLVVVHHLLEVMVVVLVEVMGKMQLMLGL